MVEYEDVYYDPRKVIEYGELISKGGCVVFPRNMPFIEGNEHVLVGVILAGYGGVSTFGVELRNKEVYERFKKMLGWLWFSFGGAYLFYKIKLDDKEKCLHEFRDNALISSRHPKKDGLEKLLEIAEFKLNLD